MSMNKNTAVAISELMLRSYEALHLSTDQVRRVASDEEHKMYCRLVGMILGYMLLDLMTPLYDEHPELMPDFMRSSSETAELGDDSWPATRAAQAPESECSGNTRIGTDLFMLMDKVATDLVQALDLVSREHGERGSDAYRQRVNEILEHVANAKEYLTATHLGIKACAEKPRGS